MLRFLYGVEYLEEKEEKKALSNRLLDWSRRSTEGYNDLSRDMRIQQNCIFLIDCFTIVKLVQSYEY